MRAFIAITPDADTRDALAEIQRRGREQVERAAPHARVTWTNAEAIHLTVRFFARLDPAIVSALHQQVSDGVSRSHALTVPLTRIGGFPRLAAPRVIWIGPPDDWMQSADGARLAGIAQAVDHACDALGLEHEDRRWSPHLTLARVKEGERRVGDGLRGVDGPHRPITLALRAGHITLYRSDLAPRGAVHTPLWTLTLPQ